jgi:rod shape-determining protein MreD
MPFHIETHNRWLVWLTLVFAILIDSISWSKHISLAIPDITPLILLYWVLALEKSNFLLTAVILGLFHDALYHTHLGTYSLIYAILIYPVLHLRLQIRNLTLLQISLLVAPWFALHQLLIWLLTTASNLSSESLLYFMSAIMIAVMLWPWLFLMLRSIRRAAKIR